MIDHAYCQTMARYNQWMNQKLYAICAEIPDEERKRDRGAFFKSIHGTLNHLLYGDRVWLGRFLGQPFSAGGLGQELYSDFDELCRERQITDEALILWTNEIEASWLERSFEYTSGIDQKTRVLPAWVLVTHVFNHQTHHRGQLTTLLSQMGLNPGITDLPWLPTLNT